jgi:polyphenol oxidase
MKDAVFVAPLLLRRAGIFESFENLAAGVSTRHGGVSPAPYASLNLGKSTDDRPENIAENRRRFCDALGFRPEQMAWSKQVHGDQILTVTAPGGTEGFDALITDRPGILLTVSVADCTPILVFDTKNRIVAAIHAGWRGTSARIVEKTIARMAEIYGASSPDCRAYIGPCIDECAFEVGAEVAEAFDDAFKRFDPARNKFFIDLKQANRAQLLNAGIPDQYIEVSPFSTVSHNGDYFSHRTEKGVTGRMLGAIGLLEQCFAIL